MVFVDSHTTIAKGESKITQKEIDELVADKRAFCAKMARTPIPTPAMAKEFQQLQRRVRDVLRRY